MERRIWKLMQEICRIQDIQRFYVYGKHRKTATCWMIINEAWETMQKPIVDGNDPWCLIDLRQISEVSVFYHLADWNDLDESGFATAKEHLVHYEFHPTYGWWGCEAIDYL